MSRIKDWIMSEHSCTVCGVDFVPAEGAVYEVPNMDLAVPVCSKRCDAEYHQVMNAIADMQGDYCPECEQPKDHTQSA